MNTLRAIRYLSACAGTPPASPSYVLAPSMSRMASAWRGKGRTREIQEEGLTVALADGVARARKKHLARNEATHDDAGMSKVRRGVLCNAFINGP